jgi:hypothetical protein
MNPELLMRNDTPRAHKLSQTLIKTFREQLKDLEKRLDNLYSDRDEAISEGKFDRMFDLNRTINYCLENKDSLSRLIEQEIQNLN